MARPPRSGRWEQQRTSQAKQSLSDRVTEYTRALLGTRDLSADQPCSGGGTHSSLGEPHRQMGQRRDMDREMAPTEDQTRAHSPGCTRRTKEGSDWNCRLVRAVFPDGVGHSCTWLTAGRQRPADTCGREMGPTENRQEGGVVGGREETKSKCQAGLSVSLSVCPPATGLLLRGEPGCVDRWSRWTSSVIIFILTVV